MLVKTKQFKRAKERKELKEKKKQLLSEMSISMSTFKKKMPKVDKCGKEFDVVDKRQFIKYGKSKGKKMSLQQQVIWLEELKEATKELRDLREELEQQKEQQETIDLSQNDVKDETSFKVV